MSELKNLIATAKEKGSFPTLMMAAEKLKLVSKYSNEGPFTIFAPVESAFEPIPDDVIDESFDDHDYLLGIINYHIVEGRYTTKDLEGLTELETISGNKLKITVKDGIKVDTANIIEADIECSNGIIHAIDEILIP
ncbi:fasciclin domain-containing protein [Methanolobus sediminis]|uniref:Fasciclin domain-containing protein n=1 Tax=Methanolobus sediminis TaxID=3072978 RepID=A0AA51YHZ2_9EURY|nr:fasciclin domain-containing protein [Methanolobus sediminis]WMW23966.1 fasciclin domain-containing protein [Methanolobus sediminis]